MLVASAFRQSAILKSAIAGCSQSLRFWSAQSHPTPTPISTTRTTATATATSTAAASSTGAAATGSNPTKPGLDATTTSDSAPPSPPSPLPNKSLINRIIYGDPATSSNSDATQPAESHSKLVGANQLYEMHFHHVKPDRWNEYMDLTSQYVPKLLASPDFKGRMTGSWTTAIGDPEQALTIYEYDGFAAQRDTSLALARNPAHAAYTTQLRSTLRSRHVNVVLRFQFWQLDPSPMTPGSLYELRSYILHPGKLLEWEQRWRRGLECRRQFCQPVGAWFSHVGDLNKVYHLWLYADLEKRKQTREAAWQVDGWAQTVYNTVPLIQHMDCTIMYPREFSPLK
ncbi:nipsnap family protein [Capsaspora owczarzaki ATCC 30864]|uniref:Nipsnap family protein n=1 Tax=Capsaspora owczarzaki (strain ATCC 30864) TaxID=595528 RepID=A0A0D2WSL1_CAPO3|nr:nipsnap family protein [Capsaspora owczarzaki ATCC 30864]KJE95190.1 nipsnap family protein [Capsaspora owczarzaki ATCC 30864]|eukprot:XP_004346341.1 nipsnap family protein [Capsaspora owczarzaki ATCC 30864]